MQLWKVEDSKPLHTLDGHSKGVKTLAWSPDSNFLATASAGCPTRVWDVQSAKPLPFPDIDDPGVAILAFTPDGTRLAAGSSNVGVRLRDVRTGKMLADGNLESLLASRAALAPGLSVPYEDPGADAARLA